MSLQRTTFEQYKKYGFPLEDKMLASVDDTSLITGAMEASGREQQKSVDSQQRSLSRYGVQMSALQQQQLQKSQQTTGKLDLATAANTASIAQQDRNENVLGNLLNTSRDLTAQNLQSDSNLASLKAQRDQANDANKAQKKQQMYSTAAMLGTIAIMAM